MAFYKYVSYAYATSDTAKKFGFPDQGCHTVEKWDQSDTPSIELAGFDTHKEALEYAATLPLPVCPILGKYFTKELMGD